MNDIDDDFPTIRRARTHPHDIRKVNIQPFVGRLGGNQLFTTTDTSVSAGVPDAKRTASWRELLDLRGFLEWSTWQNAIIEAIGIGLLVFMTGLVTTGVIPIASSSSLGPIIPVSLAAVFQFIVLTLFIFTLGPVSGATSLQVGLCPTVSPLRPGTVDVPVAHSSRIWAWVGSDFRLF